MDIKHLKTFSVINRTGSFSYAAKILGYAQPTVTMHIQLLEEEFQVKLFERLGHKIKITQQGEQLLYYAEKILAFSEEAVSVFMEREVGMGKITIGANQSFSVVRLPFILKSFIAKHPSTDVSLKFGSIQEIYEQIRENVVDVAFFLTKEVQYTDLIVEKLFEESIVVVIAPDHPFCRYSALGIQDFQTENLIITQENCTYRAVIDELLQEAGVQPHSLIEINNIQAIKQLVMSGLGITVLPRVSVEYELTHNLLTEVPWKGPPLRVFTQIAYHKDKWLSPTILSFLEETRMNYL
ncbi:DNA-binding transcriptional LysR family regulator [Sporomusaceae bacterium BoRhaA]|uniref:LysR family transcriptional regulator n=1 Tax=Pelorhabdus rhamnosifermentans TaxID=2772457 RepID=UPI001C060D9C|nr:LysR family transcriptional regulator [Pelorhabdus rhamnosifermentans]MBU2703368.1 DNA-binding transcriptional LysR family regulator [Pelorhabdus rhamnosifermentans]